MSYRYASLRMHGTLYCDQSIQFRNKNRNLEHREKFQERTPIFQDKTENSFSRTRTNLAFEDAMKVLVYSPPPSYVAFEISPIDL